MGKKAAAARWSDTGYTGCWSHTKHLVPDIKAYCAAGPCQGPRLGRVAQPPILNAGSRKP
jgi:hypothetical protein